MNGDTLSNVRRKENRHFWNKRKEYLKARINELLKNSKTQEYQILV
jgi:Txe/YoeB family toxin of Txe-Axe toxin-antitoxin module